MKLQSGLFEMMNLLNRIGQIQSEIAALTRGESVATEDGARPAPLRLVSPKDGE